MNFADRGIALTRRFRALKIWLSVKVLGVGWFRDLVEHCCRLADYAQALLEAAGRFEILCPRRLSIVCFRYRPPGILTMSAVGPNQSCAVEQSCATGRLFISFTRGLAGAGGVGHRFVNWRDDGRRRGCATALLATLARKLCDHP